MLEKSCIAGVYLASAKKHIQSIVKALPECKGVAFGGCVRLSRKAGVAWVKRQKKHKKRCRKIWSIR